ncbi:MAG TPA: HEPN domain-containing protein [Rhodothermales bacterium]|nr:HEPN domain-containing protein [Rhodothermales bacterium]
MSDSDDQAIIKYRLERARESLLEARLLAEAEQWSGCVNRLYYASFYAVSALLQLHGITPKTHAGVRSEFSHQFVRTNLVATEWSIFYNELFLSRQKADYQDFMTPSEQLVRPWLDQAEQFVNTISALIDTQ